MMLARLKADEVDGGDRIDQLAAAAHEPARVRAAEVLGAEADEVGACCDELLHLFRRFDQVGRIDENGHAVRVRELARPRERDRARQAVGVRREKTAAASSPSAASRSSTSTSSAPVMNTAVVLVAVPTSERARPRPAGAR